MGRPKLNKKGIMVQMDVSILEQLDLLTDPQQRSAFIQDCVERAITTKRKTMFSCNDCWFNLIGKCNNTTTKLPCEFYIGFLNMPICGWCAYNFDGGCEKIDPSDQRHKRSKISLCELMEYTPNELLLGKVKRSIIDITKDKKTLNIISPNVGADKLKIDVAERMKQVREIDEKKKLVKIGSRGDADELLKQFDDEQKKLLGYPSPIDDFLPDVDEPTNKKESRVNDVDESE